MCDKQATQQGSSRREQQARAAGEAACNGIRECAITAPAIIAPSQQTERLGTKRAHLRGLLLSSERYALAASAARR